MRTLDGLTAMHPVFGKWAIVEPEQLLYVHYDSVRPVFTELVELGAMEGHGPKNRFSGRHGFSVRAMTLGDEPGRTFSVDLREANYRNDVNCIHLGNRYIEPLEHALVTPELFRSFIKLLVEIWRPSYVVASTYTMGSTGLLDPSSGHLRFHSPWLAYLPDRMLMKSGLPADMLVERIAGGVILAASMSRLDMSRTDHAEASGKLLAHLIRLLGERRRR